jgi:hypothetical protein
MIHAKTVLITGVGASAPYGYPLGAELLDDLRTMGIRDDRSRLLANASFSEQDLGLFYKLLKHSPVGSIDQFIALRGPPDPSHKLIARYCVAYEILCRERIGFSQNLSDTCKQGEDWYSYLWDRLVEGIADFQR